MRFIRNCPLFLLLVSTGLLFTVIAIGGKNNIYRNLEYHPLEAPLLSLLFVGVNQDIYPWQMFDAYAQETMFPVDEIWQDVYSGEEGPENGGDDVMMANDADSVQAESMPKEEITRAVMPSEAPRVPEEYSIEDGRLAPLRESTREEYLNHISADIYGDAGVIRAATYNFVNVDESYFDDALFIGDSRTVGLRDYTDLSEHADFLCEVSLTIYKVLEESFPQMGTVKELLEANDYGKIYIMIGINELGSGTTETFMAKYTEVIDTLHALEPEAMIFIQGVMNVTGSKDESDAIFNNRNIMARNNAIATLADNVQIFYIDVNEVLCDEQGNLDSNYTFDQIHLLGIYNDLWKQFLMSHGVL